MESYLDTGDRANFGNGGETIRLFADFTGRLDPQTTMAWETRGATPLVMTGEDLAKAKAVVATETPCKVASRRKPEVFP